MTESATGPIGATGQAGASGPISVTGPIGVSGPIGAGGQASVTERPPLDPAIVRWLADRASDPTAADPSVAGQRRHSEAVGIRARAALDPASPAAVVADERDVEGAVPVRVFRPAAAEEPVATIVHFHGGGWIAGGPHTSHLHHARRICAEVGAVVVSVDYRLAPEHPFPAAFEDCLAVTRAWAGQGSGPLAVAGDSAGAQLAASVALACRDEGIALAAQLLLVPATDRLDADYLSRRENASGFGLTTSGMRDFVHWYAGSEPPDDWRLFPQLAPSHAGVAPAVVVTTGYDVLRDEGARYARTLADAGVPVVHREWPTLNHGFFSLGGVSAEADLAAAKACQDLRRLITGC